ncbi:hypothetical protein CVT24_001352 [Panaeolus cyanescens]|uniref:Uncharacterized protein n=1 Tax=Panaeolus cyanescens TaxID=181874 RepID=A0A409WXP4_9AGAR|nr:hypothetical protein CVT24_001352 [Panaeolus cyanescens]
MYAPSPDPASPSPIEILPNRTVIRARVHPFFAFLSLAQFNCTVFEAYSPEVFHRRDLFGDPWEWERSMYYGVMYISTLDPSNNDQFHPFGVYYKPPEYRNVSPKPSPHTSSTQPKNPKAINKQNNNEADNETSTTMRKQKEGQYHFDRMWSRRMETTTLTKPIDDMSMNCQVLSYLQ